MALTEQQLAMRMTGIGGSEVAAVAGLSPWAKPIDVYMRKLGLGAEPSGHHIERGNYLEQPVIDWYADRYDVDTLTYPGTVRHPQHDIVLATPDAIADGCRVVEVKCPGPHTVREWGEGESDAIPPYYRPQVMWEMAVTGLQHADVVALIGGDIRRFRVAYSQRLFEALLDVAQRFWRNHIQKRTPPPADGSDSYSDYLRELFPCSDDDVLETSEPDDTALAEAYRAACIEADAAVEHQKLLRQRLEERIGTHAGMRGPWGSISFRHNKDRSTVDYKALIRACGIDDKTVAQHTRTTRGARPFKANWKA